MPVTTRAQATMRRRKTQTPVTIPSPRHSHKSPTATPTNPSIDATITSAKAKRLHELSGEIPTAKRLRGSDLEATTSNAPSAEHHHTTTVPTDITVMSTKARRHYELFGEIPIANRRQDSGSEATTSNAPPAERSNTYVNHLQRIHEYPYVYHNTLEELRADPILPHNWTLSHITEARIKLIHNHAQPSPLSEELEDILKNLDSDVVVDANVPKPVNELAKAQRDHIRLLTDSQGTATDFYHINMFFLPVFSAFFGSSHSGFGSPLELKIAGQKIITWYARSVIGNNLCRVHAYRADKVNLYEDVAYLLSFAQHTRSREPYILAQHGHGRLRLLKADIGDAYMTGLMKGNMKDVDNELHVEVIGKWNLSRLQDRVKFVAMMADLSKRFGIEKVGSEKDG